MTERRWAIAVLTLAIVGLAVAAPAYSQQDEGPLVPPQMRPGHAPLGAAQDGPRNVFAEVGTDSFDDREIYRDQWAYANSGYELKKDQPSAREYFRTDGITLSNDFTSNGWFYCSVWIGRRGFQGRVNFDLYKNGKKVDRKKVAWSGGKSASWAGVNFWTTDFSASEGDELKCMITIPKKGIGLAKGDEVWSYVELWDIQDAR